jgi:hypothetical protein
VSEVPRQEKIPEARILPMELFEHARRTIAAAIVDKNHRPFNVQRVERRGEGATGLWEDDFLVEGRDHDAQVGPAWDGSLLEREGKRFERFGLANRCGFRRTS